MTHQAEGGQHSTLAEAFKGAPSSRAQLEAPTMRSGDVSSHAPWMGGTFSFVSLLQILPISSILPTVYLSDLNVKGKYSVPQYDLQTTQSLNCCSEHCLYFLPIRNPIFGGNPSRRYHYHPSCTAKSQSIFSLAQCRVYTLQHCRKNSHEGAKAGGQNKTRGSQKAGERPPMATR